MTLLTQWLGCYWGEEDTWFYFEADDDGLVTRQIELQGPERTPIAAAQLDEWRHAWQEGSVRDYESRYGRCADQPLTTWRCPQPVTLTRLEYDKIWQEARQAIDRRL